MSGLSVNLGDDVGDVMAEVGCVSRQAFDCGDESVEVAVGGKPTNHTVKNTIQGIKQSAQP